MTKRLLLALSIACASQGCKQSVSPASAPTSAQVASAPEARTVDSFDFIGPGTTVPQVVAKVGAPDDDIGTGHHVYVYRLSDGAEVLVGSPDGSEIWYARHGSTAIYEGPLVKMPPDNQLAMAEWLAIAKCLRFTYSMTDPRSMNGCRYSKPLSTGEIEQKNMVEIEVDGKKSRVPFGEVNDRWQKMKSLYGPGDEYRYVHCLNGPPDAGVGLSGYVLVRDSCIVETVVTEVIG
jgi:hypothetical protein